MASHFHIFRTEDIKLETKDGHKPIFESLDVEYFFQDQWFKSLIYEKTDFQQRRTQIQLKKRVT